MPVEIRIPTAKVISVHEEPTPVVYYAPNVIPGEYLIPGVGATEEFLATLQVRHRDRADQEGTLHRYAHKKQKFGITYVEIEVCEALTFIHNPAQQKQDEFGKPLIPDIARIGVPVRVQEITNDIEMRYGGADKDRDGKPFGMGILAIAGEEPTEAELREALRRLDVWEASVLTNMDANFERFGIRMVTEQAKRIARKWHTSTPPRLNPLPRWASINPQLDPAEFKACPFCGGSNKRNAMRCQSCTSVLDWKAVVEAGQVKPSDVPPSKRAEAGLEPSSENQTETPVPVDAEVPATPKAKRGKELEA